MVVTAGQTAYPPRFLRSGGTRYRSRDGRGPLRERRDVRQAAPGRHAAGDQREDRADEDEEDRADKASLDHFRVLRRDRAGGVIHEFRLVA
jgi:hypothetical protein